MAARQVPPSRRDCRRRADEAAGLHDFEKRAGDGNVHQANFKS
jgi:hypothetical protein